MLDRIGDDEQLIFTTHNTDMLDLNPPKHSYVFCVSIRRKACIRFLLFLHRM